MPQQQVREIVARRPRRRERQRRPAHQIPPRRQRLRQNVVARLHDLHATLDRVLAQYLRQVLLHAHVFPNFRRNAARARPVIRRVLRRREEREALPAHARNPQLLRPIAIRRLGILRRLPPVPTHSQFADQRRRNRVRIGNHHIRLVDRERNRVRIDQLPRRLVHPPVAERRVVPLRISPENLVVVAERMVDLHIPPRPERLIHRRLQQVLVRAQPVHKPRRLVLRRKRPLRQKRIRHRVKPALRNHVPRKRIGHPRPGRVLPDRRRVVDDVAHLLPRRVQKVEIAVQHPRSRHIAVKGLRGVLVVPRPAKQPERLVLAVIQLRNRQRPAHHQ